MLNSLNFPIFFYPPGVRDAAPLLRAAYQPFGFTLFVLRAAADRYSVELAAALSLSPNTFGTRGLAFYFFISSL